MRQREKTKQMEVWSKVHSLHTSMRRLSNERLVARREIIESKQAWDLIIEHVVKELEEIREMVSWKG